MSKKHKKTKPVVKVTNTPPVALDAPKEVKTNSFEGTIIAKKLKDLQVKYRTAMKTKQELTQKLRVLDEETTQMVGAHKALIELKADIEKDVKPVETEPQDCPKAPVKDTGEEVEPTKGNNTLRDETKEEVAKRNEEEKKVQEEVETPEGEKEEKTYEGAKEPEGSEEVREGH